MRFKNEVSDLDNLDNFLQTEIFGKDNDDTLFPTDLFSESPVLGSPNLPDESSLDFWISEYTNKELFNDNNTSASGTSSSVTTSDATKEMAAKQMTAKEMDKQTTPEPNNSSLEEWSSPSTSKSSSMLSSKKSSSKKSSSKSSSEEIQIKKKSAPKWKSKWMTPQGWRPCPTHGQQYMGKKRGRPPITDPKIKEENKKKSQIKAARKYRYNRSQERNSVEIQLKQLETQNADLRKQFAQLLAEADTQLSQINSLPKERLTPQLKRKLRKPKKAILKIKEEAKQMGF